MNKKISWPTGTELQDPGKAKTERVLRLLLFAHILLVSFQIPLRAMFLDTTYFRDILLVTVAGAWFLAMMVDKKLARKQRFGLLEGLVALYLAYGCVVVSVCLYSGFSLVEAVGKFRNHFSPFILFFVAKTCLASSYDRAKIVNLLSFIAAVMLLDVFVEYYAFLLGYSQYIFPWYSYQFVHSYRFVGNISGVAAGYIQPGASPLLGLLGWPHATSATFLALFAFVCPFLWGKRKKIVKSDNLVWCMRYPNAVKSLLILVAGIGIILLKVKMQMVSFLALVSLSLLFSRTRQVFRILALVIGLGIVVLVSDVLSTTVLESFRSVFQGDTNPADIQIILGFDAARFFTGRPLWNILFGWWGEGPGTGGELRLSYYTLHFGLTWLFLFIMIFIVGSSYARKIRSSYFAEPIDRQIAMGLIGLLFVCFLDMGHYARLMTWPIIDIMAVCLGALAAIDVGSRRRRVPTAVKEENCAQ